MKVKNCHLCSKEDVTMLRIKITSAKDWIFVCKTCCQNEQKKENYKYGGTWKGNRH